MISLIPDFELVWVKTAKRAPDSGARFVVKGISNWIKMQPNLPYFDAY